MATIMDFVNLRNKPSRAGFDLSRRVLFTAKVGEIDVVNVREVLPNDKAKVHLNAFGRSAPMNTASFGRIREYYDVYFVPYRLLYKDFNNVINQVDNPVRAKSLTTSYSYDKQLPYFTAAQLYRYLNYLYLNRDEEGGTDEAGIYRYESTSKLLSYLGYRLDEDVWKTDSDISDVDSLYQSFGLVTFNAFPLLAYQKIYQDYFRFTQWEDASPWTYNVDYLSGNSKNIISYAGDNETQTFEELTRFKNMFDMQYCNYDKDYFHGILPRPQYGNTAIASPISGSLVGSLRQDMVDYRGEANQEAPLVINPSNSLIQYLGNSSYNGTKTATTRSELVLNEKTTAGISVLALRQANMLQKWEEITLSSSDYSFKTLLEKHWGVSTSDILSDKCTYLGGIARTIGIQEVENTNFDVTVPNSELRGIGSVSHDGTITFNNPNNEYGLMVITYHAKPVIEWRQRDVCPKYITKTSVTDYAIPELDSIGMQGVPAYEFMSNTELENRGLTSEYPEEYNKIFTSVGYAPRYIDYKTNFDLVLGEFDGTLESWTLPYSVSEGESGKLLTYLDFKVQPKIVDGMFGVAADGADHFRNSLFIKDTVVRSLDKNGLPY